MNERVIISRKWANPHIVAFVDVAEIGAKMDIEEYLESLVLELTNIPLVFTKTALLEKLREAHKAVSAEMRNTTKYIV